MSWDKLSPREEKTRVGWLVYVMFLILLCGGVAALIRFTTGPPSPPPNNIPTPYATVSVTGSPGSADIPGLPAHP